MDDILPLIINSPNQYVAAKDTYGKYLFCNDNVAQIAQLDSPKQIIGKSDYDLIWHNYADLYRRGDNVILKGGNWFNVEEPQLQANGPAKILITKSQLLNKSMECCGVITSFIDITGHTLKKVSGYYDPQKHRFYLGEVFENTYLTNAEYLTFKYLCLGYSSKKIGLQLELSPPHY